MFRKKECYDEQKRRVYFGLLLAFLAVCNVAGAINKVIIKNRIPFKLEFKISYMGESPLSCRPDKGKLNPEYQDGDSKTFRSYGCFLKKIEVKALGKYPFSIEPAKDVNLSKIIGHKIFEIDVGKKDSGVELEIWEKFK